MTGGIRVLASFIILLLIIASDSELAMSRATGSRLAQQTQSNQGGAANPEPPRLPQRTEILNFDDWAVTCVDYSEGPRRHVCSAGLRVTRTGTDQVVLAWSVGLNDQNKPVTVFQTPTGIAIKPGVELHIEHAAVRKVPFESCFPNHCVASIPIDGAFVRDISEASTADIVFQAANGRDLKFNIPIKGFAKAYAALTDPKSQGK